MDFTLNDEEELISKSFLIKEISKINLISKLVSEMKNDKLIDNFVYLPNELIEYINSIKNLLDTNDIAYLYDNLNMMKKCINLDINITHLFPFNQIMLDKNKNKDKRIRMFKMIYLIYKIIENKVDFQFVYDSKQILWMKHTPTGCSAHNNINYFPVKSDGTKIKGYNATYKRMNWDAPASAVTMRNDAISSQDNVHPGHLLPDGTYSDARVLSLLELFRVSSLPDNWNIPEWATDTFIRRIIGEGVPPKLTYNIVKGIDENND